MASAKVLTALSFRFTAGAVVGWTVFFEVLSDMVISPPYESSLPPYAFSDTRNVPDLWTEVKVFIDRGLAIIKNNISMLPTLRPV